MKSRFHGGVHPLEQKDLVRDILPQPIRAPERVIIPLRQHIGAPCRPLVAVGETVLAGQKIGDGEGLCVPVHASISGRVLSIEDMPHPTLGRCMAVVIENDFRNARIPSAGQADDPAPADLSGILREAGIAGMGGAGFPTEVKAASSAHRIDTLIINACECEPCITADEACICARTQQVLDGIDILRHALRPVRTVLAIESNKPAALAALHKHLPEHPEIALMTLPVRYPQGSEKQLILSVTGRETPPGRLPADVGCAVFNVSTAAAVSDAVREGMPLTQRIVTVSGEWMRRPQNLIVPIGTPLSCLIRASGGLARRDVRLVCGGPMMGIAQPSEDVPVIRTTNAVLALAPMSMPDHPVCIRCGRCADVCPMHLLPLCLYRHAGNAGMQEKYHLFDCIECGCCSYACPGHLPLTETFRASKRALREVHAP